LVAVASLGHLFDENSWDRSAITGSHPRQRAPSSEVNVVIVRIFATSTIGHLMLHRGTRSNPHDDDQGLVGLLPTSPPKSLRILRRGQPTLPLIVFEYNVFKLSDV